MPYQIKRYGWIPDLPDHRDLLYQAPIAVTKKLPPKVDLRLGCPPVYDQGDLGSCTANAVAGAIEFSLRKQSSAHSATPSRLFIYYNERVIEGTVNFDAGAQLRSGIKSVAQVGYCAEKTWPYELALFTKKPSDEAYAEASHNKVDRYLRLAQTLSQLKGCLAAGYPFVFGFTVYESFESDDVRKTGIVSLPDADEKILGGHAVLAVGYDEPSQRFIVRNSWGDEWGMGGYFTMPYAYLLQSDLSSDFWTVRHVADSD